MIAYRHRHHRQGENCRGRRDDTVVEEEEKAPRSVARYFALCVCGFCCFGAAAHPAQTQRQNRTTAPASSYSFFAHENDRVGGLPLRKNSTCTTLPKPKAEQRLFPGKKIFYHALGREKNILPRIRPGKKYFTTH